MVPKPETPGEVFTAVCPLVTFCLGAALELDETETVGITDAVGTIATFISVDGGGATVSRVTAFGAAEPVPPEAAPHLDITPMPTMATPKIAISVPTHARARGARSAGLTEEGESACISLEVALGIVIA